MTRHIHIDALGGMSGDMFIASMIDAFPALEQQLLNDLDQAGILEHVSLHANHTLANGINALSVDFKPLTQDQRPTHHYLHIKQRLQQSLLNPEVLQRTIAIFDLLAEAEAKVHGVHIDHVHFHEVADWDSQADIVAAASLIEHSEVQGWSCGALPIGGGTVSTEHGELPIPAPATAHLLSGFLMHDDGESGERVTPTGAAILKYLIPNSSANIRTTGELHSTGTGCGTKRFQSVANITRILVFNTEARQHASSLENTIENTLAGTVGSDNICVINFDVDDMTPEELSVACQFLRHKKGVIDVQHTQAIGKKGRTVFAMQVLCELQFQEQVVGACFDQTSTIGVRYTPSKRYVLSRSHHSMAVAGNSMPVKTATRPDGTLTTKIESDALLNLGTLRERRALTRETERGTENHHQNSNATRASTNLDDLDTEKQNKGNSVSSE